MPNCEIKLMDEEENEVIQGERGEFWVRCPNVMKGYWNNDSLQFVGKNGVTYGYANTLNNYKKNYNSPDLMGQLHFNILQVKQLSAEYCFVLGQWFLKRKAGDVGGHYTLLFRKIKGSWCIVSDHSS